MVYFFHPHVCVKCRKRAGNLGVGCALIKAFRTGSQWVNASQIASTHTPWKIVGISKRSLIFSRFEAENVLKAWFKRHILHAPNQTAELSACKMRRLKQLNSADLN